MKTIIGLDGKEKQVSDDTIVNSINGVHYELTPEELKELENRNAAWEAGEETRQALRNIVKLEQAITPRRMREAVLNIDNGWLSNQNALIAVERAKL